MSIADAVRARELEARVAALEERLAALERRSEPSPAGIAFVKNIERARNSKTDDAA